MPSSFPFIGEAYKARSISLDCQECMNLYPEIQSPNGKNVVALIGTAGLNPFIIETGTVNHSCRCLYTTASLLGFAVIGNKLYSFTEKGKTEVGVLYTSRGYVSMADNGICIVIVDGHSGYLYNLKGWTDSEGNSHTKGSYEKITWDEFPNGATHVRFKDGRFVVNEANSGRFHWSQPYDGAIWYGDSYATAEGSSDNLVAIHSTSNDLWLFGTKTTEIWTSSGDPELPFIRMQNAIIEVGTEAPFSVANLGSTVFWLGSNLQGNATVFAANGYAPQAISNHGIEWMLSQMRRRETAIGYCYQQEGHEFYVLNLVDSGKTLAYDLSTSMWHERGRWNGMRFEAHRAVCHTMYNKTNIVGDRYNGNIYKLDLDYYTDNGELIRRVRSCPHLHSTMNRVFYYKFELDLQKGIGLTTPIESQNFT